MWISVKDELPPDGVDVLVLFDLTKKGPPLKHPVGIAHAENGKPVVLASGATGAARKRGITHWARIPELPNA